MTWLSTVQVMKLPSPMNENLFPSSWLRSFMSKSCSRIRSEVAFRDKERSKVEILFSKSTICFHLVLFRLEANPIFLSLMNPFTADQSILGSSTEDWSSCSFISLRNSNKAQLNHQRAARLGPGEIASLPNTALWSERDTGRRAKSEAFFFFLV